MGQADEHADRGGAELRFSSTVEAGSLPFDAELGRVANVGGTPHSTLGGEIGLYLYTQ
ncbi:MAG: hypothetical protein ACTJLL_02560 [Anaplasma sp.]